ncbi:ribbon-helix-helix protein, CopG family [candidate division WOR-3 bacterium]|nr:ribbon-helix-helix protein, CopG family [candidate division WOR-3 bacterium]
MRKVLSISLTDTLKKKLDEVSERLQRNRSEVVKEALREFFARQDFKRLRGIMMSEAEKKGIYTDEDVFNQTS